MSDQAKTEQPKTKMEENTEKKEEFFPDIKKTVDDDTYMPTEIESFCVNCEENGVTRLMMVSVPHFKELILASFECPHCGYKNQEVQFGGKFDDYGIKYELKVTEPNDLNRQIVKADYCTISFPEIEFEIPPNTQKGTLTTLEGIIQRAIENLNQDQPVRRVMQPEVYKKVEEIIGELDKYLKFEKPFTVIVDDPAGNSNVQNFLAPKIDPNLKVSKYKRTKEQDMMLGIVPQEESQVTKGPTVTVVSDEDAKKFEQKLLSDDYVTTNKEIINFPERCFSCRREGVLRMIVCDIPYFKEIILMAFSCEHCGYKNTEVKAGGAIAPKGKKLKLTVLNTEDLTRDVLKAESASIEIPEIDLFVAQGSLGGKFTTIEGLLKDIKERLEQLNAFKLGDSTDEIDKTNFEKFLSKLNLYAEAKEKFTIIIDDPLSNSYIQNIYAPDPDPQLVVEEYTRSYEQDEALGLHDMKVEGYQTVDEKKEEKKDEEEKKEEKEEKKEETEEKK